MIVLTFSKKILNFLLFFSIKLVFVVLIAGCSNGNLNVSGSMENIEDNTLTRIQDLPFIKNSEINIETSLIMGEGKTWSGQLNISVPEMKNDVFNFYVKNLGDFGWKEQTTIRGETSILNYIGDNNRVAIISIEESRFNNSRVLISISPYTEEFEEKVGDYINENYLDN
tara:strand:+ start:1453 stop:1959 length:507 start_codon:yes stop_codon:yes gene_type:complete